MERGATGQYETTVAAGERVRAFVPAPLPPRPRLDLRGPLERRLESASLALGRLDSVSDVLAHANNLVYSYVRKESVLSSQIEGIRSSLSDLLFFERGGAVRVSRDDVEEVAACIAATDHGLRRLAGGLPLSNRLIREVHGVLFSHGRGPGATPGEFRRSQNWLGGYRPGVAVYVPPPHARVRGCMADLERFLHDDADGLPRLVKAGLAHVQFETIHPFLDGNGRVGRLLVTLFLVDAGVLRQPLLFPSLFLKRHRQEYYRLLDQVRRTGDWEAWLAFFLEGLESTAEGAVATAQELVRTFRHDQERIDAEAGRKASSARRVHGALQARVVVSLGEVARRTGLTFQTVSRAMDLLVDYGIAREVTGGSRNRLYAYREYLAVLDRGVEGPPG